MLKKKKRMLPIWAIRSEKQDKSRSSRLKRDRKIRQRIGHLSYLCVQMPPKVNVFESNRVYCPRTDRIYFVKAG